jgi:hypothetical protein
MWLYMICVVLVIAINRKHMNRRFVWSTEPMSNIYAVMGCKTGTSNHPTGEQCVPDGSLSMLSYMLLSVRS